MMALFVAEITCTPVVPGAHLHVSVQRGVSRPGDALRFSCDYGFQLRGVNRMRCGYNGNWSEVLPSCIQINCTAPPETQNAGRLRGDDETEVFPVGVTVHYTCKIGYYVSGRSHIKCTESGDWESHRPSCVRVTCTKPESISNGYYQEENAVPTPIFEYNSTVQYFCEGGYQMEGEARIQCLASGDWNATSPSCEPILCPSPETIHHGDIRWEDRKFGSRLSYKCHEGYKMVGEKERQCQMNGQWSGEAPECEQIICPIPLKPESGFIRGDDFTFDRTITYECSPGYSLVGNKERKCTKDKKWSGSQPTCVPVECPMPRSIANGRVVGSVYEFQSNVEYTCEAGHRLKGLRTRRCNENATWSGQPPVCERVECPHPEATDNGFVVSPQQVYLPGSVVQYACRVGYEVEGKDSRTCREDGTWTGHVPECQNITCKKPKDIKHGRHNALEKAYNYGTEAVYHCEEGYQLDGPARRMCSEDKTWSGAEPECVHVECPELNPITNGHMDPAKERLKAGESATYKCEPGFELIGEPERICLMNGTWDRPTPYCSLIECDKPADVISNGRMLGSVFSYRSTVEYVCDSGYEIDGTKNRTCQSNGQWDNSIPVCEKVHCPIPGNPEHGKFEGIDFRYQQRVTYYCNEGFVLEGHAVRTCTAAKVWDFEAPTCVRVKCPFPTNVTNGQVVASDAIPRYEDKASYSCNEGFRLIGTSERHCTSNGTWSDSTPVCQRVSCGQPPKISDGTFVQNDYKYKDVVQFRCYPGFVLDVHEVVCSASGEYQGETPTCHRITCPMPDAIENGQPVINGTRFEDFVNYKCDIGHRLIGEETRNCIENGTWTGRTPRCEIITCGVPTQIAHSVLETRDIYTYGEYFSLDCLEGYRLRGKKSFLCQADGSWETLEAECVLQTCSFVGTGHTLINGSSFLFNNPVDYDYGTIVQFSCERGFELQGASVVTCSANNSWEPALPTCVPVKCPKPDIENSLIAEGASTLVFGKNLTVTCVTGYKVMGNEELSCTVDGSWFPEVPKCVLVTCSHPSFARAHGRMVVIKSPKRGVGYPFGITLKFDCNEGFEMRGSDVTECLASGLWSNENPRCVPIQCRKPWFSGIANLTTTPVKDWYDIGENLMFQCNYGFELEGISEMSCNEGARWSDSLNVFCREILCGPPQLSDSFTSDSPGLFQRKYKVGNTINYRCNKGWVIEGSARAECLINRTWSSQPTCRMITCPTVNVSNAEVTTADPSTKKLGVNTEIEITCHEGFVVRGVRSLRCLENGTWDAAPPECDRVECPAPLVQNARISAVSRELRFFFGDPLYVECAVGYELQGSSELHCRADGTWSGIVPVCNIVNCTSPVIPNGYVTNNRASVSYRQTISMKCDMGYTMKGPEVLNCTADGTWSDDIPVCGMVFCKTPSIEQGQIFTQNEAHSLQSLPELPFNQTITIACSLGYELAGSSSLTCLHTGYWSKSSPICNRKRCTDPTVAHGIIMGNRIQVQEGYGFGDSAKFSCEEGFELLGAEEIICQPNGTWSSPFPECRVLSCSAAPSAIQNAAIVSYPPILDNNYTYATRVQVTCERGFRLIGDSEIACGPQGQWSGIMPVCHRLLCANPDIPFGSALGMYPNQGSQTTQFSFGHVVTFRCQPGFELHGVSALGCQEDGTWNASFPVCVRTICHAPVVIHGWIETKIYRFGDNVTLQCVEGFEPAREHEAVCQANATWSANLECTKISCPTPSEINHGEFSDEGFNFEDSVHYSCHRGFVLNGTALRTCLIDKRWSGEAPFCERLDCGNPSSPDNGEVKARGTKYGSRARVLCNEGYNLVTAQFIRCTADGKWSEENSACEPVKCERLSKTVPNAFYLASGRKFGDKVQYVCLEGFRLEGPSERVCGADGLWHGDIPDCIPAKCPDVARPKDGSMIGSTFTYGSNVTFSCDLGFRLVGSNISRCLANASWSDAAPTCEIIQCPDLKNPDHGIKLGDDSTFGAVLEIACDVGYQLIGHASRICQSNGSWSGNDSICRIISCPQPNLVEHGNFTAPSFSFNSTVKYTCDESHDLFGPSRRMCQADGTWTEISPSCVPKRCPQPPAEQYATMQADGGFKVGSYVTFDCEPGYKLVGQHILKCKGDKWDAPYPRCTKVQCGSPKLANGVMYEGTSFEFGDTLHLKCMTGFVLVGSQFCFCETDGKWVETDATCEPISCGTPPHIVNTIVHSREYVFGEYVFYKCQTGYELSGNNLLQCNEMGEWVGKTPKCSMISCGPPPVIHRATTTVSRHTYGSRTTYLCNRGYILRGSDTLVCMGNGTWQPPASALVDVTSVPRCDPVNCGAPPRIGHGQVQVEAYTVANIATYACSPGHKMIGVGTLQCGAEGYWNGSAPRCLRISCDNPPLPANAVIISSDTVYNGTVVYSCEPDHFLSYGGLTLQCGAAGTWIGEIPVCAGIICMCA